MLFLVIELAFALGVFFWAFANVFSFFFGSPYLSTKNKEILSILQEADLKKGQLFLELGCGRGRILQEAVRRYGVKGVGVDINPVFLLLGRLEAFLKGTRGISFRLGNLYSVDLSQADVIYLFLLPKVLKNLSPKLVREAKKGAIIVSHAFELPTFQKFLVKKIDSVPFPTYFYQLRK